MLENHENCTRHIYSAKEKLAVRCKSSPQKYPTHLYIRGEFFYYRRRIPKKYSSYNETTEIRFSLQTDSFREAREKTTFITATLRSLFQEKGMVTSEDMAKMKLFLEKECPQFVTPQKTVEYEPTVVDIHAWLNANGDDYKLDEIANIFHLKYALTLLPYFPKEKLSIILDGKNKVQLTYDEISKRLVGHFRHALSCDAQNPNSRTLYENRKLSQPLLDMSTPEQMGITTNSLYSLLLTHHKSLIDNPPLLCLHCLEVIEELIESYVFRIDEFSYEN